MRKLKATRRNLDDFERKEKMNEKTKPRNRSVETRRGKNDESGKKRTYKSKSVEKERDTGEERQHRRIRLRAIHEETRHIQPF